MSHEESEKEECIVEYRVNTIEEKYNKKHHIIAGRTSLRFFNPWMEGNNGYTLKRMSHFFTSKHERLPNKEVLEKLFPLEKKSKEQLVETDWKEKNANIRYCWVGHATVLMEMKSKSETVAKSDENTLVEQNSSESEIENGNNGNNNDNKPSYSSSPSSSSSSSSSQIFRILTDPIFENGIAPFETFANSLYVPRYTPPPFPLSDLPKIDAVVISHGHADHLCIRTVRKLGQIPGLVSCFVVPLGMADILVANCSISRERITELDWYQELVISKKNQKSTLKPATIRIIATPAQHWSGRYIWRDKNESLWVSYCIIGSDARYFFAGDTGLHQFIEEQLGKPVIAPIFKDIGDLFGPFDVSSLPVGACTPRESNKEWHISPSDAMEIHRLIRCKKSVGMHFGTFGAEKRGYRPIITMHSLVEEERKTAGLEEHEFVMPKHGKFLYF